MHKGDARKRKTGRPPAGIREGEMVRNYPQLSVRVPPEIIARLNVTTTAEARPQWRIICEALECYFRDHPESTNI
jgi:hypothetical protein